MSVPLLRWGIEHSDADCLQQSVQAGQTRSFDPELIELILGKDDPVRMRECAATILDAELTMDERTAAFELLIDLSGQIDNANNVAKMGLWEQLLPLLGHAELASHTAWLVAVCVQNNPEAADYLMQLGILERLMGGLSDASLFQSRKTVSALSALFQASPVAFDQFVHRNGLSLLRDLLQSHGDDANLRERILHSLNFYCKLCGDVPESLATDAYFAPLLDPVVPELDADEDVNGEHQSGQ